MPAGRPKKSETTKDLAGTSRPDRNRRALIEPETTPELPQHFPEPPDFLSAVGRKSYYLFCTHLKSVDGLWKADYDLIVRAAFWHQLWEETVILAIAQPVQTFDGGARQISPEMQILNKAEAHLVKYCELLGIGPKARESIGVFNTSGSEEGQDAYSLLLKKLDE